MTTPSYFNVTTPIEGNDGKTRFNKVGVAFPQGPDAKSHMKIILHAIPLSGELVLFAPKDSNGDHQD